MHSRIFQISKTPICKDDYIDESRYYDHWFVGSVADYVNGDTNREDDIMWLAECYGKRGISFGKDDYGKYFIIEDRAKFFGLDFEQFRKVLKEISTTTLDDFIGGKCGWQLCSLKAAYSDEIGFYVDGDEIGFETFSDFVRYAELSVKYYIGATIDYHC